jgi:CRP/FNR family transcriptional regulator, cyclic AMP receptor protein
MRDDWEFCSRDLVSAAECSSAASITRVISMKAGGCSGRGSLAHPGCEKLSPCGTFTSDVGGLNGKVGSHRAGTKPDMPNDTNQAMFDPKEFLANVGEGKTILEFRKDEIVFAQGDVANTVFYIQKGRVKVVVISEQGKEAVVGILEPGQFFGEGCMNGHSLRIATTTAMEECLVTAITKTAMLAALHDQPTFSELFMAYLLTRNSRIEEDLIDQLFNSSEKRLARLLLLLANFGKEGSPQPISPNISQETLAEMIGTTRSRVSFFMNKFRKLGLISYNGKIEVNSSLLNAVLYDKPEIMREL